MPWRELATLMVMDMHVKVIADILEEKEYQEWIVENS